MWDNPRLLNLAANGMAAAAFAIFALAGIQLLLNSSWFPLRELTVRGDLSHTKRGELVYEPFLGSGTTLAAAEITERVCLGIELDPKYVDVVIQRWQTMTGKKATLEESGRTFDEVKAERMGVVA